MNSFIQKIITWGKAHKIVSAIVLVVLIGAGYGMVRAFSNTTGETRYVLGTVQKGTVVASVSASGQVSASNQLDIKPKASGEVVYVGVAPGQKVAAGTLIAQLDASDAQKTVRDAEISLESAQLSLAKLTEPADTLSRTQAENAVATAYNSSRSDIVSAYFDLQSAMAGLTDINGRIGGNQFIGSDAGNLLRHSAGVAYDSAQAAYKSAFADYSSVVISSADDATIERILKETANSTELALSAVKGASAFLQWYEDTSKANNQSSVSSVDTDLTSLTSYAGKFTSNLSTLIADSGSIREKQLSLDKLQSGADTLDVRSSQLSVTKAQNALQDAQNNLADYYIRAPFAGTIAAVSAKKYDSASSGTTIATLITSQKIAELSLNEVDAAKIKVGDKATLTFDAIEDLTFTGKIAEIDTLGTVSQGVVSYTVKIGFDSQDERIKAGMTVNAAIITEAHQDVLIVPSSAVKTQNGLSVVQVFDPPLTETGSTQGVTSVIAPKQVQVTTGISGDTTVEITSGLTEGQQVVTRTTTGTAPATTGTSQRGAGAVGGIRL